MKYYYLIYYNINQFMKLLWFSKTDTPEYTSCLMFSGLEMINLVTIFCYFAENLNMTFLLQKGPQNYIYGIIIVLINAYILVYKGKYKKIFANIEAIGNKNGELITIIYVALTILLFINAPSLKKNKGDSYHENYWQHIPKSNNN